MTLLLLALRNVLRNRRRSLATVAAVLVGLSALNLFGGYIADVYRGLQNQAIGAERLGHLTIAKTGMQLEGKLHPKRYMFDPAEAARLRQIVLAGGGVRLVSPRLSVSGMASNGRVATIFVGEGLVPADTAAIRGPLPPGVGGRLDPGVGDGAAVSADLARLLGLRMGDTITLLSNTLDGQANALDARIVDIYHTGNAATDDKYLLLPFAQARKLLDTGLVERFVVLLDDAAATEAKRAQLRGALRAAGFDVEIRTWKELSSFYTQVHGLFDLIFGFIASIVLVVAAMSIASTISMTVVERTREVGTLRALGLDAAGVVRLFGYEALWLTLTGVLGAALLSVALAALVNHAGISYVPPNASNAVPLRVDLAWSRSVAAALAVLVLALASALWPSLRAARRGIVDALTHA